MLATVVSDVGRRRVIEVLDGRSRRIVEHYLRNLREGRRVAIKAVALEHRLR